MRTSLRQAAAAAVVILVACVAAYIEFRPDSTTEVPFATIGIAPGDPIDESNTEMRPIVSRRHVGGLKALLKHL